MALTKAEHAAQTKLDALHKTYMTALYAKPRHDAECLRLAQEMLALCTGTRLEKSATMRVKRHQK